MTFRTIDQIALDAKERYLKRRAILFAEEAVGTLLEAHGRKEAVKILRELTDHIEVYG